MIVRAADRFRSALLPAVARHVGFLSICGLLVILFWSRLRFWFELSISDERYSHAPFIPLISAGMLYIERNRIFRAAAWQAKPGLGVILFALLIHSGVPGGLSVSILAAVIGCLGGFLLCYGERALKAAVFPALFLTLMVPLPAPVVERISLALQAASAELSYSLFRLFGVPVFRQDFVFSLPGLSIQVAEECSGIRSTISLIISGILMAYLFLESLWLRVGLIAFTAFVAVFKNAARIVVISCLGAYIDPEFLHGTLHHRYGGTVFSAFALTLILPLLLGLRRRERATKTLPE